MRNSLSRKETKAAVAGLKQFGLCGGEFRTSEFTDVFNFENTSPARIGKYSEHYQILLDRKMDTFIIIFVDGSEIFANHVINNDPDFNCESTFKTVGIAGFGDCYIHNITPGIFLIDTKLKPHGLYHFYKLSCYGLNAIQSNKSRSFFDTNGFNRYLQGNVFLLDRFEIFNEEISKNAKQKAKLVEQLRIEFLQEFYHEKNLNFNKVLEGLTKRILRRE